MRGGAARTNQHFCSQLHQLSSPVVIRASRFITFSYSLDSFPGAAVLGLWSWGSGPGALVLGLWSCGPGTAVLGLRSWGCGPGAAVMRSWGCGPGAAVLGLHSRGLGTAGLWTAVLQYSGQVEALGKENGGDRVNFSEKILDTKKGGVNNSRDDGRWKP